MMHGKWSADHLNAVWKHAGPHPKWRYVPKAPTGTRPGHWEVWDRKEQRFLNDDEFFSLSLDTVRDELFLQ